MAELPIVADDVPSLVASVERALDEAGGEAPAGRVAQALRDWLANDPVLPETARTPDESRYGQRVLHTDPQRGYSIAAFVWLPGQETPVHDHRSWCVTGLLAGSEAEERFSAGTGSTAVVSDGVHVHEVGSVCVLEPPHDVHRMWNHGVEVSISVHVYGIDLDTERSSIAHTYGTDVIER